MTKISAADEVLKKAQGQQYGLGAMTTAKPRPPPAPGETRAYPVLPLRDIVA
jgi:hypothetical protein